MMSTSEKTRRIFDRSMNEWIEMPEDTAREYGNYCQRTRKKEQYHGRCRCPRKMSWVCDGMCVGCVYRMRGDLISLNEESFDDVFLQWELEQPATTQMQDRVECIDLLDRVLSKFKELDKDADTIISMWLENENLSDSAIARALGRPQRTFSKQMRRYREEFRKIRGY